MTIQQQAYGLIDSLPDDSVKIVIQVMKKMLPNERKTDSKDTNLKTSKMNAYLRMQELRKESAKYIISNSERAAAIDEKFGILS